VATIEIGDLSVALPAGADRTHAVRDIELSIGPGEMCCIVGESGSGKSVTAQAVMGLLPPALRIESGSILYAGKDLCREDAASVRAVRGSGIGMIFQDPMTALNPLMTVEAQIDEILGIHTALDRKARRARVAAAVEEVYLEPERFLPLYPHQLSGGQRQRVMIAIALVLQPKLLIADEPTTALDVTTQAQILHLMAELQRRHGTAVMFVTHDFGVVAEIADSVHVMRHGEVVESGEAAEVLREPRHDYTRMLLDAVPSGDLVERDGEPPASAPLVEVRDVSKVYIKKRLFGSERTQALDAVSFDVHVGEVLGIVGESGSGKSTVARCIARLLEADSGRVRLDGHDFLALEGETLRRERRAIQTVFQDPFSALNPRRTVGRSIAQGLINYGESKGRALATARTMLERVGLDPTAADRYPNEFSGGQRQRICIARALVLEPRVLIADEAVSALDVSVQAQVLALLRDLRDQMSLTIIFITHDLRVAAELCDRLIVMREGKVVESGAIADILLNPEAEYTRSLIDAVPGRRWESFGARAHR